MALAAQPRGSHADGLSGGRLGGAVQGSRGRCWRVRGRLCRSLMEPAGVPVGPLRLLLPNSEPVYWSG